MEQKDYEELRDKVINKFKVIYKDALAMDLCEVPKDVRIRMLDDPYYLMKTNDIPLSKAYDKWKRSFKFDKHVYEIMMFIVKKDHPRILINRNPTLMEIWCP